MWLPNVSSPHEQIADTFLDRFQKEVKKLGSGDPMDPKTTLGTLYSGGALDLVVKQIKTAVDDGAKVLLGGKRLDRRRTVGQAMR